MRFCDESSIVLVGHSHYFRELLKNSIAPNCMLAGSDEPEVAWQQALKKKKLSNGGVARLQARALRRRIHSPASPWGARCVSYACRAHVPRPTRLPRAATPAVPRHRWISSLSSRS